MSKNLKKLLTLALSLVLLIQSSSINVVQAKDSNTTFKSTMENIIQDGDLEAAVSELNQVEAQKIWNKIESRLNNTEFFNKINEQNFVEIFNYSNDLIPLKIQDLNSSKNTNYIFNKVYISNNDETLIMQFIYDEYTNSLTQAFGNKYSEIEGFENFFEFSEFNKSMARGFNFDGQAFACSLSGLAACTSYCWPWAIVNGVAGAACEVLCGIAMAAVCAIS